MSKLADQLREHGIFNEFQLLSRFGEKGRDIALTYTPASGRTVRFSATRVYSPSFKTAPNSAWYDNGQKSFVGNRAESMLEAIEWASATYGITEWAPSPCGGATVPKYVRDAAIAFVKSQKAA